jgi:DNA (cytosine-5)-methyltransferase 1
MPGAETKPPFRVPTMAEVRAIPYNGASVVSTFSGGGGSSLGYRMAGFRVRLAVEFVEAARDTYHANFPDTPIDERDIRAIKAGEVLEQLGMKPGELDVFDGSPPCSDFSTNGKRSEGWGKVKKYSDTSQRVDDLFLEYIRLLRGLRPKVFVAENVSGLVKGVAKGRFIEFMQAMKASGYVVQAQLLDAQWLGVPQARKRIIFMGVRNDLGLAPAYPRPLSYRYTVKDALPWINRAVHDTSGNRSAGDFTHRPCPTITAGVDSLNSRHYQVEGPLPPPVEPEADISRFAIGAEWDRLAIGRYSKKYRSLVRVSPDRPVPTVCTIGASSRHPSAASVAHPYERRRFSIGELRRLCSFPDDFVLTGSYGQQWERCARSVPPLMMRAVAEAIQARILTHIPGDS